MHAARTPVVNVVIVVAVMYAAMVAWTKTLERDAYRAAERKATLAAQQAVRDAVAAKEKLEQITKELDDFDRRVAAAVNAVVNAHSEADRSRAKAKLIELQKEQYELKQRYIRDRDDLLVPQPRLDRDDSVVPQLRDRISVMS